MMNRLTTWLWCIGGVANLGVGALMVYTCALMSRTYADLGGLLPEMTERLLSIPWWPYPLAGVGFLGAILSAIAKDKDRTSVAALFTVLIAEVILLAISTFALCLPLSYPLKILIP